MNRLAENLASVKARILKAAENSGRKPEDIRLIAVSKTRNSEYVRTIQARGQRDFGENYLQEALEKIEALKELDIRWHFIGPIQSNKTKAIAENFDWIQTLDRSKIARRLNEQRPEQLKPLNVCIQINLDNETSKSGTTYKGAFDLADLIASLPNLRLRGLMYIPAPRDNAEAQLQSCKRAYEEFKSLQRQFPTIDTLSLGMSSDLEAAVQAGSTMVRIGTDIFGARSTHKGKINL